MGATRCYGATNFFMVSLVFDIVSNWRTTDLNKKAGESTGLYNYYKKKDNPVHSPAFWKVREGDHFLTAMETNS